MGDAMLADPQGQKRLPVAGVYLNQAFDNALDTEATLLCSEPRTREGMESAVAQHPGLTIAGRPVRGVRKLFLCGLASMWLSVVVCGVA
jgi:hypothetical protein